MDTTLGNVCSAVVVEIITPFGSVGRSVGSVSLAVRNINIFLIHVWILRAPALYQSTSAQRHQTRHGILIFDSQVFHWQFVRSLFVLLKIILQGRF